MIRVGKIRATKDKIRKPRIRNGEPKSQKLQLPKRQCVIRALNIVTFRGQNQFSVIAQITEIF